MRQWLGEAMRRFNAKSKLRRRSVNLSAALVVATLLGTSAGWWLPLIGHWLARAPQPAPADAIVVLGGGDPERIDHAMALYRRGLAGEVWHTGDMAHLTDP